MKTALPQNYQSLRRIILTNLKRCRKGMSHAELVKSILDGGYSSTGTLSEDVMFVINRLSKKGCVTKDEETRKIRRCTKGLCA